MNLDDALRVFGDAFAPRRGPNGAIVLPLRVTRAQQQNGAKLDVTVTRRVRTGGMLVDKAVIIRVTVPRGVGDKQQLRLAGQGDELPDGRKGDLFLEILLDDKAPPPPPPPVRASLPHMQTRVIVIAVAVIIALLGFFVSVQHGEDEAQRRLRAPLHEP